MSTRKPTTQIDRIVTSLRSWIRRAADSRDADRRMSATPDTSRSGATAVTALPLAQQGQPEVERRDEPETTDADTSRQDETTGPTGASVDEFDEGTAPTDHPGFDEIEEAAEPDPDMIGAGSEQRADETEVPVTSSDDTDHAIDGTLDADRLPFDDAIIESDMPTDEALAATDAAELDAAETDAANAFAEDENLGSTPALLDADDDPSTDDTVLPDDEEDVADLTGPPVDRSGFPDLSMDGDTDYDVAGYPSDYMDGEERSDPDDAGLYERETMEADPDDAADRSDEVGMLGLADSETIAVADTSTDAASPMPIDTGDIGVGGTAEVDDTSMLTSADLATAVDAVRGDPDLADAADEDVEEDWLAPVDASTDIDTPRGSAPARDDLDAAPTTATDRGTEGRVRGDGTGACPADYPVKGKATSKIYHLPDSPSYAATRAEWCFASEQEAVAAGYRAPGKRNQSGRRRR